MGGWPTSEGRNGPTSVGQSLQFFTQEATIPDSMLKTVSPTMGWFGLREISKVFCIFACFFFVINDSCYSSGILALINAFDNCANRGHSFENS